MADVEVSYKGSTIGSLSASGTLTLETEGKYCEDDITVGYTSPGGGGVPGDSIGVMTIGNTGDGLGSTDINANTPGLTELRVYIFLSQNIKLTGFNSLSAFNFGLNSTQGAKDQLETLDLNGANITATSSGFRGRPKLKSINAKVKVNSNNYFLDGCSALTDMQFQENATDVNFAIKNAPLLSNASLVSAANGLKDSASGTLTATSAQKTAISSIMGTVANGVFTEDAGGSVSLQNFITNTKGWTLA